MNIKQAKEYIKNSVTLYLKKDEYGEYRMPVVRQRPIFLLGAPGIGKTAIMEQIAQELGIALVSYSMTHHTRQSALGLPFITQKEYDGRTVSVSEYTMSEIIASIHETMENSRIREGILFLDEINCVSETLSPAMLQFLQYKVFGRHSVPEGWVIVTAGNPPEYNKSVREFDVVTMDRLKILEVEPDLRCWKEYAAERGIHSAVMNFLDLKKDSFYCMETTVKGRSYVTARGWEDLSQILKLYEEEEYPVDEALIGQYLRNDRVVKEFAAYYDLYIKYKKDYQIADILAGQASARAYERAGLAAFDERLSLLGMLLDRVQADMKDVMETTDYLTELLPMLKGIKALVSEAGAEDVQKRLETLIEARTKQMESLAAAGALSDTERKKIRRILSFLEEGKKQIAGQDLRDGAEAFGCLKCQYDAGVAALRRKTDTTSGELHALFSFVEDAGWKENEMLILMTELTVGVNSSRFIAAFGSEDYRKHNQELLLSERQEELMTQIDSLELT